MYEGPSSGSRDQTKVPQRAAGPMTENAASARPSIPGILDEQNSSIIGLHKLINELENRLSQVLSHDVPVDASNRIDPPPPIQVADRLVTHNRGIDMAQQRLGQLMQRLHL
jgi:hypothetical protein